MKITLFNLDVEISLRAHRAWNDFKVFKREGSNHVVWGKLSIHVQNWTLEIHPVCAECGSASVGEVHSGDEGWTVCQSCQGVEQGYKYVNLREYDKAEAV